MLKGIDRSIKQDTGDISLSYENLTSGIIGWAHHRWTHEAGKFVFDTP